MFSCNIMDSIQKCKTLSEFRMKLNVFLLVDWNQPNNWTGAEAALYRSFDTPDQIMLMEGSDQSNFAALVPGLVLH